MFAQNNFLQMNYLSHYDLINKYNLLSVENKPCINDIVLDFSLTNFLNAIDVGKLTLDEKEFQIKSFVCLFLCGGNMPIINAKKVSLIKSVTKKNELTFSIKMKISGYREINTFLILLFIESWNRCLKEEITFFNSKFNILNQKNNSSNFNFGVQLPAICFYEFYTLLTTTSSNVNLKEFAVSLNFLIQKPKNLNLLNTQNFIKNLPLFWITTSIK